MSTHLLPLRLKRLRSTVCPFGTEWRSPERPHEEHVRQITPSLRVHPSRSPPHHLFLPSQNPTLDLLSLKGRGHHPMFLVLSWSPCTKITLRMTCPLAKPTFVTCPVPRSLLCLQSTSIPHIHAMLTDKPRPATGQSLGRSPTTTAPCQTYSLLVLFGVRAPSQLSALV